MLPKGYYRGTGFYVENKSVPEGWCIMSEGVGKMGT